MAKKKKEEKPVAKESPKGAKRVGNIPLGFSEKSELFMEDGKIYIK